MDESEIFRLFFACGSTMFACIVLQFVFQSKTSWLIILGLLIVFEVIVYISLYLTRDRNVVGRFSQEEFRRGLKITFIVAGAKIGLSLAVFQAAVHCCEQNSNKKNIAQEESNLGGTSSEDLQTVQVAYQPDMEGEPPSYLEAMQNRSPIYHTTVRLS